MYFVALFATFSIIFHHTTCLSKEKYKSFNILLKIQFLYVSRFLFSFFLIDDAENVYKVTRRISRSSFIVIKY